MVSFQFLLDRCQHHYWSLHSWKTCRLAVEKLQAGWKERYVWGKKETDEMNSSALLSRLRLACCVTLQKSKYKIAAVQGYFVVVSLVKCILDLAPIQKSDHFKYPADSHDTRWTGVTVCCYWVTSSSASCVCLSHSACFWQLWLSLTILGALRQLVY